MRTLWLGCLQVQGVGLDDLGGPFQTYIGKSELPLVASFSKGLTHKKEELVAANVGYPEFNCLAHLLLFSIIYRTSR